MHVMVCAFRGTAPYGHWVTCALHDSVHVHLDSVKETSCLHEGMAKRDGRRSFTQLFVHSERTESVP